MFGTTPVQQRKKTEQQISRMDLNPLLSLQANAFKLFNKQDNSQSILPQLMTAQWNELQQFLNLMLMIAVHKKESLAQQVRLNQPFRSHLEEQQNIINFLTATKEKVTALCGCPLTSKAHKQMRHELLAAWPSLAQIAVIATPNLGEKFATRLREQSICLLLIGAASYVARKREGPAFRKSIAPQTGIERIHYAKSETFDYFRSAHLTLSGFYPDLKPLYPNVLLSILKYHIQCDEKNPAVIAESESMERQYGSGTKALIAKINDIKKQRLQKTPTPPVMLSDVRPPNASGTISLPHLGMAAMQADLPPLQIDEHQPAPRSVGNFSAVPPEPMFRNLSTEPMDLPTDPLDTPQGPESKTTRQRTLRNSGYEPPPSTPVDKQPSQALKFNEEIISKALSPKKESPIPPIQKAMEKPSTNKPVHLKLKPNPHFFFAFMTTTGIACAALGLVLLTIGSMGLGGIAFAGVSALGATIGGGVALAGSLFFFQQAHNAAKKEPSLQSQAPIF